MSRVNKVFPKCQEKEEKKFFLAMLPDFGTNLDYLWEIGKDGFMEIIFSTSQKLFHNPFYPYDVKFIELELICATFCCIALIVMGSVLKSRFRLTNVGAGFGSDIAQ